MVLSFGEKGDLEVEEFQGMSTFENIIEIRGGEADVLIYKFYLYSGFVLWELEILVFGDNFYLNLVTWMQESTTIEWIFKFHKLFH